MTEPLICKFTTSSTNYDLFADTTIRTRICNQFGSSILASIDKGDAGMNLTVFVNSPTQIKLKETDDWNDFIRDIVYSSNGTVYKKHCYIKDPGISGTLSIQIR
jgi:hypothetical protein